MKIRQTLRLAAATCTIGASILLEGSMGVSTAKAQTMTGDQPTSLEALQSTVLRRNDATGDQPVSLEALRSSARGSTLPSPSTSPSPEVISEPIAMVTPMDGQLMVSMTNNTGAMVTYEVVGDTARRMLEAGESTTLRGLSLPSTITLVRQDSGLLDIEAESMEEGMLSLSLTAEPSLDDTQGVLRIQEDGQVFVN